MGDTGPAYGSMNTDIDKLVTDWVAFVRSERDSPESERYLWAHGAFWDLCRENPDDAWCAILNVLARNPDARVIRNLAAGPMEDLLTNHGAEVIDRVEKRARADRTFAALLGGVWKNDMTDEIWSRVSAAKSRSW
jgi:hypothetical protein